MKKAASITAVALFVLALVSCETKGPPETSAPEEPTPARLMLDWVPNTNHTGIFVAKAKNYFEEAGLDVEIIEPGEVYAQQAVLGGSADFGVSFQEQVTLSRADGAPLVSIAAVINHNSSGFASRAELGAGSPADWEGMKYGSYGSPFEEPTLRVLMECAGGDFGKLEVVSTGFADPLALLDEKQTDLAWIFYGWQGVQADLLDVDLNVVMMDEWFDCVPDYYTPIFIASEATVQERPELVRAFLAAVSRGYDFAIENPEEAAGILLEAVPELDREMVLASQAWLSPRYRADAARWGEQKLEIWDDYSRWMAKHEIIPAPIDAQAVFTNEFLP
jgi:ABC-type nitrate/sulfonate/bicarbonate transport system substrate-binding protein